MDAIFKLDKAWMFFSNGGKVWVAFFKEENNWDIFSKWGIVQVPH